MEPNWIVEIFQRMDVGRVVIIGIMLGVGCFKIDRKFHKIDAKKKGVS